MAISTNSVFHFTNSKDSLKGILANTFRVKYCLERIESKHGNIDYAVPMVSFCDIPLSQVSMHINKYGGYGIGLSKKWAKRKGLNPVLYLDKNSIILNEVLMKAKLENNSDIVYEFLRYTKNYDGELVRDGHTVNKNYRYYDEREWRFSPSQKMLKAERKILFDVEYYKYHKQIINERLSLLKLQFKMSDVSYLILRDEDEILEILEYLESINYDQPDKSSIKVLSTRIITSKQIKTDF